MGTRVTNMWGIVLAAGESKRMGVPKMLLDFGGESMLERVLSNIKASRLKNVIVVIGAYRELMEEILDRKSISYCYNDNYSEGMLSSVKCGFSNLPSSFGAALVFQGDQPLVTPTVINMVINSYVESGSGLVVPAFKGRTGHPFLINEKYRSAIETLSPEEGLRSLKQKFSDDLLVVETNEPGILKDFDTFEEYEQEIKQSQRYGVNN